MDESTQGNSGDPSPLVEGSESSDEDEFEPVHQKSTINQEEEDRKARLRIASQSSPSIRRQEVFDVPFLEHQYDLPLHEQELTSSERVMNSRLNKRQIAHIREMVRAEVAAESRQGFWETFEKQTTPEWHKRVRAAELTARAMGREERDKELADENAEKLASHERQMATRFQEGMEEGRKEGMEVGRGEGRAAGRDEQRMEQAQQLENMQTGIAERENQLQQRIHSLDARQVQMETSARSLANSHQEAQNQLAIKDQEIGQAKARCDELMEGGNRQHAQLAAERECTTLLRQEVADYKERLDMLALERGAVAGAGLQHDDISELSERVARCSIQELPVEFDPMEAVEADPMDQTSDEAAADLRKAYDECDKLQQALDQARSQLQARDEEAEQSLAQYNAELAECRGQIHRLEEGEKERGRNAERNASLLEEREAEVANLRVRQRQQQLELQQSIKAASDKASSVKTARAAVEERFSVKIGELSKINHRLEEENKDSWDRYEIIHKRLDGTGLDLKKAKAEAGQLQAQIRDNDQEHRAVLARLKGSEMQLAKKANEIKNQSARISQLEQFRQDGGLELQSVKKEVDLARKETDGERRAKERVESKARNLATQVAALQTGKKEAELKVTREVQQHRESQKRLNQVSEEHRKLERQLTESREQHAVTTSELQTAKTRVTELQKDKKALQAQRAKIATEILELRTQLGLPDISPVADASEELDEEISPTFLSWQMLFRWLVLLLLGFGLGLLAFWMGGWWAPNSVFARQEREMWRMASPEIRRAIYQGKVLGGVWVDPLMGVSRGFYG